MRIDAPSTPPYKSTHRTHSAFLAYTESNLSQPPQTSSCSTLVTTMLMEMILSTKTKPKVTKAIREYETDEEKEGRTRGTSTITTQQWSDGTESPSLRTGRRRGSRSRWRNMSEDSTKPSRHRNQSNQSTLLIPLHQTSIIKSSLSVTRSGLWFIIRMATS